MMAAKGLGCVVSAYGSEFDVDQFLAQSKLGTTAVWHKGVKRFKSRPPPEHSGVAFATGDAFDLRDQVAETIEFLNGNRSVLRTLRDSPGIENLLLDFGIDGREVTVETHHFPLDLILLAAEFHMAIGLDVWAP